MEPRLRMFLLIQDQGMLVVTGTDENSTRRDFRSAWKERPPEFYSGYMPRCSLKERTSCAFFLDMILDNTKTVACLSDGFMISAPEKFL